MRSFLGRKVRPLVAHVLPAKASDTRRSTLDEQVRDTVSTDVSDEDFVAALLTSTGIPFHEATHDTAFSAQMAAKQAHISGKVVGKGVLVRLQFSPTQKKGNENVMCILRGMDHARLDHFAKWLGAQSATLLSEKEVQALALDRKLPLRPGTVPPLPDLFGVRAFLDTRLATVGTVAFNAGSYTRMIVMAMHDFVALTKPIIHDFAEETDTQLKAVLRLLRASQLVVPHGILRHEPAPTAAETAKATHFPGPSTIKSVIVTLDHEELVMCALQSTRIIDLAKLAQLAGARTAALATMAELRSRIPDIREHTIPPFGHMYQMRLFIDANVGIWPEDGGGDVIFNAGTTTEAIFMNYRDYLAVNRSYPEPVVVGSFARREGPEDHAWTSTHYKQFLVAKGVPFTSVRHARAFTASEVAYEAGISGKQLAKTVMLKAANGTLAMAAVRAADRIDITKLNTLASQRSIACQYLLACEEDFATKFEHVETGAVPPLGFLYMMPTFVDTRLSTCDDIYMYAGTHKELLGLKWSDYIALAHPQLGDISEDRSSRDFKLSSSS